jgi:hypothetical protein
MASPADADDTRNTARQPSHGVTSSPTTAARPTPTGSPAWSSAAARPRILAGVDSASRACPTAHSPPTPSPVRKRNSSSVTGPVARAVSAVPSEYRQMVHSMARLRPRRSET